MCGICGIISLRSEPPDINLLQRMALRMSHRGPDEEGYYVDLNAGLGSRRLSIIDLAGGHQPISNEDGTKTIIYNGEIYNYRELRRFLEERGHSFRTKSDTEVILHLFEEFGHESLNRLDGIFALAIWDKQEQELFLARDRMGIKPIYYTEPVQGQLIFGSELKVTLEHPTVSREINLDALNEYLSYEYVPTPHTILEGIFRLEPGHYLRFNARGVEIKPYHHLSFRMSESSPHTSWRDAASNLYDTLRNAVQRELVSDVPVGVLLSGGIDSSSVAALMVDLYPGRVQSFTISFAESSFDESSYAREVAQHLGLEHNEMPLTGRMALDLIQRIPEVLDEPFADSSFIPTYLLSQFARQKVKVVLGGDGGDELFAGYPTLQAHRLMPIYERLVPWQVHKVLTPHILKSMSVSFDNISLDFRLRRFFSGRGQPLITRHHHWLGSFRDEEKALLLQEWITPVLNQSYQLAYNHVAQSGALLPLNQILYDDMRLYLEGDILYKVDRASMANSLEVRVPLLNRDGLTSKFLLKKAMRRSLPSHILNRPKKGFNMPVAYWLAGELRPLLLDLLSKEYLQRQGLFNGEYVQKLLDEHYAHQRDNRKLLWTLLMFQMWYRAHFGK
jgi:asparagine synthase (glutamine-hydrolysing)